MRVQYVKFGLLLYFWCGIMCAQITPHHYNNVHFSNNDYQLLSDSSFMHLLEIPVMGFHFTMNSDPGIQSFIKKNKNQIIINFEDYLNNIEIKSHHSIDLKNRLLHYAFKYRDCVYSFGIDHRLFTEFSLSRELISLLVNGNYQYLNQNFILDNNNYGSVLNYFSIYFGYSRKIQEKFQLSSKIKFIKGVNSVGLDIEGTRFLLKDNFETQQNPFDIELNSNFSYYVNRDYQIFSNLGLAIDVYLDYDYNNKMSFYTSVNDLGFILWNENYHRSQGEFNFDGIEYSLNQLLSTEFDNLQDTILDLFSTDSFAANEFRLTPFSTHLGVTYDFLNYSHVNINFNAQKLHNSLLYTGKISYLKYFNTYRFSIVPSYSINRYNFTNLSLFFTKKWYNKLHTNFYVNNILDFFTPVSQVGHVGFGWSCYVMF